MAEFFEWDPAKDHENRLKHGVSFSEAQLAFLDPMRVIADDMGHSWNEQRFFCFGSVGSRVMTVRFTLRSGSVRIIRRWILAKRQEGI